MTRNILLETYQPRSIHFTKGEGVFLFDDKNNRYLDFASGIGVNALGYQNPKMVEALTIAAKNPWHLSNLYHIKGQDMLGQKLVDLSFGDKVFFCNSGTEAMEGAIKITRKYQSQQTPARYEIITFQGAFHGRTLGALAAGGNQNHLAGFGPHLQGFRQIDGFDLMLVEKAIGKQTAGILIEPIQGEGGVRPVPDDFLRGLRRLCDEHALTLIFDEVQCGLGRTGDLFAHEQAGIHPDIMTLAKALGAGFPVGAILANEKTARSMNVGTHGSTFGGNPLSMAAGLASLTQIAHSHLLSQVKRNGLFLKEQLEQIVKTYPSIIKSVRGRGLMLGLVCRVENKSLLDGLFQEKILAIKANGNVVRLLPPLVIKKDEVVLFVNGLKKACARLE